MNELVILVVEDEPDVRNQVVRDLASFTRQVRIDEAESVDDAEAAIDEIVSAGDVLGLVVADHRLPGRTGVDLLVAVHARSTGPRVRTVLLTGQAGHQDTIRAINEARLDHYFPKPWDPDELVSVARNLLTDVVIESSLDSLRFVPELDGPRLLAAYARQGRED
jgi:two-component system, OmpR family, phosphate regulon response regulator PhoB